MLLIFSFNYEQQVLKCWSIPLTSAAVSSICTLTVLKQCHWKEDYSCSCQLLLQLPLAPSPLTFISAITTISPPIRACEWQPQPPAALTVPREPTAGGRSIQGVLIITNRLWGREPWHIFITVVIKAIADYHQDIKLTRHLEWADYSTWRAVEWMQWLGRNLTQSTEPVTLWFMQSGPFKDVRAEATQKSTFSFQDLR